MNVLFSASEPRIFLAQDDDFSRNFLCMVFEGSLQAKVISTYSNSNILSTIKTQQDLDLILIDHRVNGGSGIQIAEDLQKKFPTIPVVLLVPFDPSKLSALKPESKLNVLNTNLPLENLIEQTAKLLGQPVTKNTVEYSRVNVFTLSMLTRLPCECYLEISKEHYVRMFKTGDLFEAKDQDRYLQNGVKHLFVKSVDLNLIFAAYGRILSAHLDGTTLGKDRVFSISQNTLELVRSAFLDLNLDQKNQNLVNKVLKQSVDELLKSPKIEPLFFSKWVDPENYIASHSVALANIALSIYLQHNKLNKIQDDPEELCALAQAALLHDLFISNESMARVESFDQIAISRDRFTLEEVEDFLSNPMRAGAIARSLSLAPALTSTILEQHRELPSGLGFPAQRVASNTFKLATLFIFAHDYLNHVSLAPSNDPISFLKIRAKDYIYPQYQDWLVVLRKVLIG